MKRKNLRSVYQKCWCATLLSVFRDSDGILLGSVPASFFTLLHTELEDLATSPHHRSHQTKTTNLFCRHRPNPHHVNWTWSSSFETALLRTLCRTFSWGPKTDWVWVNTFVCTCTYLTKIRCSKFWRNFKTFACRIKNQTKKISKNHILSSLCFRTQRNHFFGEKIN